MFRNFQECLTALNTYNLKNDVETSIINYVKEHATEKTDRSTVGTSVLCSAINFGHAVIVNEILGIEGVNVNALHEGRTPLMHAMQSHANDSDQTEIINTLLAAEGINIDITSTPHHETALMLASQLRRTDIVTSLIAAKANVNLKNRNGDTALIYAINASKPENAKVLLDINGIDVCAANLAKETALHIASSKGDASLVKKLLKKNAHVNAQDVDGNTPLHYAIGNTRVDAVNKLLAVNGIDVNIKNVHGDTVLISPAIHGRYSFVSELLKKGIDLRATNKAGKTALSFATAGAKNSYSPQNNYRVIMLLLSNLSPADITNDILNILYELRPVLFSALGLHDNKVEISKQIATEKDTTALGKVFWHRTADMPLDENDVIYDATLYWLAHTHSSILTDNDLIKFKPIKTPLTRKIEAMKPNEQPTMLGHIFDKQKINDQNSDTALGKLFWSGRVDKNDISTRLGRLFWLLNQGPTAPTLIDHFTNLFTVQSFRLVDRVTAEITNTNKPQ